MARGDGRPIGVFDSGVGGFTVVAALRRQLPHESILYLGDTARLPYGTKSPATVGRYTRRNVLFLVERGVKAVVIACNTASSVAMGEVYATVPVWGVIEPGARAAAAVARRRVGVIGTESTIASNAYGRSLSALRPDLEILGQACPLFVPLVEEGWLDDPVTEEVARRYLAPLQEAAIDTLVLGCTHYPLLEPALARVLGPEVTMVDSADSTARAVAEGLAQAGLAAGGDHEPEHHFCVTDAGSRFGKFARLILGETAETLELVDVR